MDILECYRLLELTSAASVGDVKESYRRLARRLHPDVNPDNTQAHEQFIRVTEAYKVLLQITTARHPKVSVPPQPAKPPVVKVQVQRPPQPATPQTPPPQTSVSPEQQRLKVNSYRQLESLLKTQRVPRAIALVEALRQRLPNDPEVRQWQALIYQHWGRQLISEHKLNQARAYLKKALSTDPHNKALWAEIERDFRTLENLY